MSVEDKVQIQKEALTVPSPVPGRVHAAMPKQPAHGEQQSLLGLAALPAGSILSPCQALGGLLLLSQSDAVKEMVLLIAQG